MGYESLGLLPFKPNFINCLLLFGVAQDSANGDGRGTYGYVQ